MSTPKFPAASPRHKLGICQLFLITKIFLANILSSVSVYWLVSYHCFCYFYTFRFCVTRDSRIRSLLLTFHVTKASFPEFTTVVNSLHCQNKLQEASCNRTPKLILVSCMRQLSSFVHSCWNRKNDICKWTGNFFLTFLVSLVLMAASRIQSCNKPRNFEVQTNGRQIGDKLLSTLCISRLKMFTSQVCCEQANPFVIMCSFIEYVLTIRDPRWIRCAV